MVKHCLIKASAAFLIFQLTINFLMAQGNALLIEERDKNGRVHSLDTEPYIVDINSTLQIKLNKDALRRESAAFATNPALQVLIDKCEVLQKVSAQGLESVKPLLTVLAGWADSTNRDISALQDALKKVAGNALKIIRLAPRDSELRDALNKALRSQFGATPDNQYRAVFETAAAEAESLRAELDRVMKSEGVYYQLGAWISTRDGERPLHLVGFDNYPEGEDFEVDRWSLTPSAKQKEQLQKLGQVVTEVNEKGFKQVASNFAGSAPSLIPDIIDRAFPCIENVEQSFASVQEAVRETSKNVKDAIDQAKRDIKGYRNFLKGLKTKYTEGVENTTQSELLLAVNSDLEELKNQTDGFIKGLKNLKELPKMLTDSSRVKPAIKSLEASVTSCEEEITKTISSTANIFTSLFSVEKIDASLLEFGEEVLKLDIDSLPDETELPLKKTGIRASGDAIIIKISAGKIADGEKDEPRRQIDSKQIQLFRILSHTDVVVGMIYALPEKKDNIAGDFRLAPSYSVIFSWGKRKSIIYNTLFKPGIGINFAALDLNHDNTPEVGIGLMLAVFRNFLQVGAGYNLQEKVGYGFFGLRVPMPSLTPSGGT